jgi:hypothetical protein
MIRQIEAALRTRTTLIADPVAWEGVPYSPTKGQPYVEIAMTGRTSSPMGIGPTTAELWRGVLQITAVHPAEEGLRLVQTRAQALRDLFPIGLTLLNDMARVTIEARDIPPGYRSTDWYRQPVIIRWFAEEPRT